MVPDWLLILSWIWLVAAVASAALIVVDQVVNRPAMMPVMRPVWPITALYMGPIAVWAYWAMQRRPDAGRHRHGSVQGEPKGPAKPFWQSIFVGVTHCGAGCTLGDIIAEVVIFVMAWTIAGLAIWPEFIGDYIAAYVLGIAFQYFSIAPMRGISGLPGVWAAIKADTLSLTAFELGLFGWMAIVSFVLFHHQLHPDSPAFWFLMQVGMCIGFLTAYPMNWWLIRRGVKEAM